MTWDKYFPGIGVSKDHSDTSSDLNRLRIGLVEAITASGDDGYTVDIRLHDGCILKNCFIASPHASLDSGWLWLPNVRDIAVVLMIEGQKDNAIIMGFIHPSQKNVLRDFGDGHGKHIQNRFRMRHKSGAEILMDADGTLHIRNKEGARIEMNGTNVTVYADTINLAGPGGAAVARVGDAVQVSPTTHIGSITAGSSKVSSN
ncbi:MAG: hypothetical protein PHS46_08155 [Candidatus Omnitrophica bacterium]|nr:hypothetical protein [Candidatus Omnitrophota bacterium]